MSRVFAWHLFWVVLGAFLCGACAADGSWAPAAINAVSTALNGWMLGREAGARAAVPTKETDR